jgi:LEA14-like dessication related protein
MKYEELEFACKSLEEDHKEQDVVKSHLTLRTSEEKAIWNYIVSNPDKNIKYKYYSIWHKSAHLNGRTVKVPIEDIADDCIREFRKQKS